MFVFHLDFQLFEDGFYSFLCLDSVDRGETGAHTYKKYLAKTVVTYYMENVSNKVIYCLSHANRHFYIFCSGTSLLSPDTNKNNSFLSQWFSYINTAPIQNNAALRLILLDVQEMNLETSVYAVTILRLQMVSVQTMIFLISTLE